MVIIFVLSEMYVKQMINGGYKMSDFNQNAIASFSCMVINMNTIN
jgi:hypothetical protein